MKIIKIDKNDWTRGIDKSRETYQLFGPVTDSGQSIFKQLDKNAYPEMGGTNSVMSPKSVLFPQTEKILAASLDASMENHHIMQRPAADYSRRAVIGIRPYDAKAVRLVKLNFDTADYRDPYWCDAHGATTFVGLAVNQPSAVDFSISMGSGPFGEEGLDVLLVDLEDHYLAKVLTPKGGAYLSDAGFDAAAETDASLTTIETMQLAAEAAITTTVPTDRLQEKALLDLHGAPFWEDLAFTCINCGTCTFVCPTCWCFDIQDETKGKSTSRFRNWDTCMSPLFTLHGSGHNPRGKKTQRVRQRFMHKLKYFLDKYDQGTMCVGCGRCVEKCPVNIDIRSICSTMNAYDPKDVA
ncbi:MAG: 4Fe-4S dicluster domain-containing protein [Desulfobacterium sp.]|nr:4Fe-4S dicluster domain-containing protein [Desulfobacterium sp.]